MSFEQVSMCVGSKCAELVHLLEQHLRCRSGNINGENEIEIYIPQQKEMFTLGVSEKQPFPPTCFLYQTLPYQDCI